MKKSRAAETPADSFLRRLPPVVRASFAPTQIEAIRKAFGEEQHERRGLVDVRGVIPFFTSRFYYVLLFGRDRRTERQERRSPNRAGMLRDFGVVAGAFAAAIGVGWILLYLLKSCFGINLYPGSPFWHVLRFWR